MKRTFLLSLLSALLLAGCSQVKVDDLRTEQLSSPLNVSTLQPRLSWVITSEKNDVMQTAYHIQVASSLELLKAGKADVWDSKRVESDASIWVPYGGAALKSNQRLYWRVKVYTTQGNSSWSEPAEWGMGLLDAADWQAQWIGHDALFEGEYQTDIEPRIGARYLRKEFAVEGKEIRRAIVHVCGLGAYELYLNGRRIGDDVLSPAPTDWRQRIFYNTYDVSQALTADNAIGVTLGSGRYVTLRADDRLNQEDMFGMPKLLLQLEVEYADGSHQIVASDTTWRLTASGPIRANNEYDGEVYDARMALGDWNTVGYDDAQWIKCERVQSPGGVLKGQPNETMKVKETIDAVSLSPVGDGRYIVDFGQNISGRPVVAIHDAAEGDTIVMRFAEILQPGDTALYIDNLRSARAIDRYVSNGKEQSERWHTSFVLHGFRYMEIKGLKTPKLEDFHAELIFDDLATTGSFETSNDILNKIFRNAWWGIADNYRGMPMDCCQRDERMPWLGDRTAGCYGESFVFANGNLYAKWMTDICQSQQETGNLPSVCPTYWRIMSPNMTWPAALPMGCDMLYQHYGNLQPMCESYPYIKKWLAFMMSTFMDQDSIITKDTFGDWCMPSESQELIHSKDPARITSGALMSTAYFVKISQMMTFYAPLVGQDADVPQWQKYARDLTAAFNKCFLTVKKGVEVDGNLVDSVYYGNNTVTSNVLPLAFGMVPEEHLDAVRENIINTIMTTNTGHVSCGVVGMSWIQRELSRMGRGDIAFLLASNTSWPSYGYMIEHGATTIWELWNGDTAEPSMNSGNHVMLLGDLITWFFKDLAGIQPIAPGYKSIRLSPDFSIAELEWVKASYRTLYGEVKSCYRRTPNGSVEWEIDVPCNTTATVCLPDGEQTVGSGRHTFSFNTNK